MLIIISSGRGRSQLHLTTVNGKCTKTVALLIFLIPIIIPKIL